MADTRRRVETEELEQRSAALDRRERDIDQFLIDMEPKSAAQTVVVNYNNGCAVNNDPGVHTNALATMQAQVAAICTDVAYLSSDAVLHKGEIIDRIAEISNATSGDKNEIISKIDEMQDDQARCDERLEDKLNEIAEKLDNWEKDESELDQKLEEKLQDIPKMRAKLRAVEARVAMVDAKVDDLAFSFQHAKADTDRKLEQILAAVQSLAEKQ